MLEKKSTRRKIDASKEKGKKEETLNARESRKSFQDLSNNISREVFCCIAK